MGLVSISLVPISREGIGLVECRERTRGRARLPRIQFRLRRFPGATLVAREATRAKLRAQTVGRDSFPPPRRLLPQRHQLSEGDDLAWASSRPALPTGRMPLLPGSSRPLGSCPGRIRHPLWAGRLLGVRWGVSRANGPIDLATPERTHRDCRPLPWGAPGPLAVNPVLARPDVRAPVPLQPERHLARVSPTALRGSAPSATNGATIRSRGGSGGIPPTRRLAQRAPSQVDSPPKRAWPGLLRAKLPVWGQSPRFLNAGIPTVGPIKVRANVPSRDQAEDRASGRATGRGQRLAMAPWSEPIPVALLPRGQPLPGSRPEPRPVRSQVHPETHAPETRALGTHAPATQAPVQAEALGETGNRATCRPDRRWVASLRVSPIPPPPAPTLRSVPRNCWPVASRGRWRVPSRDNAGASPTEA